MTQASNQSDPVHYVGSCPPEDRGDDDDDDDVGQQTMMATTTTTMVAAAPTQRHRLLKKNGLRPMWMASIFGLLLAIRAAQGFAFPAETASLRRRGACSSASWPAHVSTTRAVPRLLDNRQRRNAARPTSAWISTSLASSAASSDDDDDASALVSPKNRKFVITPEGLGFTSPVRRILRKAGRAPGFHRALASDSVLAVQTAISSSASAASTSTPAFDVALVFDDADPTKLVGLFTESDYIKVRARSRGRVLFPITCVIS
jgi:hypothetical protein